jgi:methylated-DNA-[protein]-cysteine S-methyltransferase
MRFTRHDTPLGTLLLAGTSEALHLISLPGDAHEASPEPEWTEDAAPFARARRQLDAYFAGRLKAFDLDLAPEGTAFQLAVWRALASIPYGTTRSYGELARRIGRPRAVRAVGLANGANPLPIVLPCHRVIGADGSLTGYGGGLEAKRLLLRLEGAWPADRRIPLPIC